MAWQCELCGRVFAHKNTTHSCGIGTTVDKVFTGIREPWRPLYEQIKREFSQTGMPFYEYCPSSGVLWKSSCTFASFQPKRLALGVSMFSDRLHEDRNPVSILVPSKNRVTHTVDLVDNSKMQDVLSWLIESYLLTQK